MLARFNNEVLSKGPDAVLPQNFTDGWLHRIQKISEDFLDGNFSLDECKDPQDVADPILSACVYVILRYRHGNYVDISIKEMIEKMAIYAISVSMETVHRESDIGLQPPTLDNILSLDRIKAFKTSNPDFVRLLEQACIIRDSGKGWFQNIKEKLLSRFSA